jgi:hypothetical protein
MSTGEKAKPGGAVVAVFWTMLALGGCALWLFFINGSDPARAWRSLLINFLFFSSLSGGLVVWLAVADTCKGRWHIGLERTAAAGMVFSVPSLLALVVLWIGSPGWAPWYGVSFHQGVWLDNSFLFGRNLVALLVFWTVAAYYLLLRAKKQGPYLGPTLILVYCLVFSLLGFDLVMALDPHWHSNLAGGYFFMSGLYIGVTCWALLSVRQTDAKADQLHDLGKLIVAFSLMTTYLMYAHLLPFWYENLPKEIRFPVIRMQNPQWSAVSYFLLCLVYFGPLVLLLMVKAKRNRWTLGIISLLVLAGMWIERWWLVAPTFDPLARLGLTEISMALAFVGMLGLGMQQFHRRLPERYLREEK